MPISIHALREEGDFLGLSVRYDKLISIHALREEGDPITKPCSSKLFVFLSTPSARRATGLGSLCCCGLPISIHALREEGDSTSMSFAAAFLHFYPRPPRGGRPSPSPGFRLITQFLSTPSARRATAKTETKSLFSYKLYNILHGFRRALIYNGSKNYPNHAK